MLWRDPPPKFMKDTLDHWRQKSIKGLQSQKSRLLERCTRNVRRKTNIEMASKILQELVEEEIEEAKDTTAAEIKFSKPTLCETIVFLLAVCNKYKGALRETEKGATSINEVADDIQNMSGFDECKYVLESILGDEFSSDSDNEEVEEDNGQH